MCKVKKSKVLLHFHTACLTAKTNEVLYGIWKFNLVFSLEMEQQNKFLQHIQFII